MEPLELTDGWIPAFAGMTGERAVLLSALTADENKRPTEGWEWSALCAARARPWGRSVACRRYAAPAESVRERRHSK